MSDSRDDNDLGSPAQQPLPHPSLDALALAEWLAETRVSGEVPRLGELIAALSDAPDAIGILADATIAEMDESDEIDDMPEPHQPVPGDLSTGTRRAVASLFAGGDDPTPASFRISGERRERNNPLTMVAEAAAPYKAKVPSGERVGVLRLAERQGFDAEVLAAQIMLSPEVLRWLDRVALPLQCQPDALVFHLVGALGVERERVREALARGEATIETSDLIRLITEDTSLTAVQRAYWLPLLSSSV